MGRKATVGGGGSDINQSYYLYAAVLALKLLAFVPVASFYCNEKMQRANLSDLKHLTPFWLVAALYTTINPDYQTAITLIRVFVAARFVAAAGYVYRLPKLALEGAFFASYAVTGYMGGCVIYAYRNAL